MIGTSSTVISIGTIFATVATIGIPIGVQRFLGRTFSEQKLDDTRIFVKISLFLTSIGVIICNTLILILYSWFHEAFKIDFSMIIVTVLFIASSAIMTLLRSIVIASLKTKMLPIIMIFSTIAKIVLGVILVLIGGGALGITIGFTCFPIVASIFLTLLILMNLRQLPAGKSDLSLKGATKLLLIAGGASWIPYVIHTTASYLGPILVFNSSGSSQAGVYFIAYSIFIALAAIMSVLFTIAYPALSAMQHGRKTLAWRITKASLLISMPLSFSLIFYSTQVMQIFGMEYVPGSSSLVILLLSTLPILVMTGINTLVNSVGNYRQVLLIGMATNIPSAVLYFVLVPLFDNGIGAAMSYTLGSITGFLVSIVVSRKIEMKIFWKDIGLITALPAFFAFFLSHFHVNYVIGIPVTLTLSYLFLLKLNIITKIDINDSISALPSTIANPLLRFRDTLGRKANRIK